MRLQQCKSSCGPASIVNGAQVLGVRVAEATVRKLAGTTREDGTDSHQMIEAIRGVGLTASEYTTESRNHAWRWLHGTILQGSVPILCVDSWGHWVTCIGMLGDVVIIFDPTHTVRNKREYGVHALPKDKLMRRWQHAKKSKETPIYAICMSKP